MTIHILIVDDHAVARAELHNLLELSAEVEIVGEAADGWDALRKAEALRPDIVLVDLEMPGLDGFQLTRRIKTLRLAPTVIIFTVYGCAANQQKASAAGADAFLIKGTDLRTLLNTFEQFSTREV